MSVLIIYIICFILVEYSSQDISRIWIHVGFILRNINVIYEQLFPLYIAVYTSVRVIPQLHLSCDFITDKSPPTPFYNNTVLQDLTLRENATYLQSTLGDNPNLRDGIALLKVWLRQRELTQVWSRSQLYCTLKFTVNTQTGTIYLQTQFIIYHFYEKLFPKKRIADLS